MSLADDLDRLWSNSDSPPELEAWVRARRDQSDAAGLLVALRFDQKRRWASTNPWLTEDYLTRLPLPEGPDWRFELAIGEFEARRDTAQPMSLEDLNSRFPDLSETLKQKLTTDRVAADSAKVVISPPGESPLTATYITARGVQVGQHGRYRLDRILGEGTSVAFTWAMTRNCGDRWRSKFPRRNASDPLRIPNSTSMKPASWLL
jgi:hypothetical protein